MVYGIPNARKNELYSKHRVLGACIGISLEESFGIEQETSEQGRAPFLPRVNGHLIPQVTCLISYDPATLNEADTCGNVGPSLK